MGTDNNKIEVEIDGQVFKLMASESPDYIRNIAKYIDKKVLEVNKLKSGSSMDERTRWLLVSLNIVDELFKEIKEREKQPCHEEKPTEDNLEIEKYINELHKMQEENFMLNEKIVELQLEIMRVRKEFDEFIDTFGNE